MLRAWASSRLEHRDHAAGLCGRHDQAAAHGGRIEPGAPIAYISDGGRVRVE